MIFWYGHRLTIQQSGYIKETQLPSISCSGRFQIFAAGRGVHESCRDGNTEKPSHSKVTDALQKLRAATLSSPNRSVLPSFQRSFPSSSLTKWVNSLPSTNQRTSCSAPSGCKVIYSCRFQWCNTVSTLGCNSNKYRERLNKRWQACGIIDTSAIYSIVVEVPSTFLDTYSIPSVIICHINSQMPGRHQNLCLPFLASLLFTHRPMVRPPKT